MGSQTTAMYAQIQRLGAPHNQSFRAYKLFSADGGKPVFFNGAGTAGLTAVKKGSAERVQELLSVMNLAGLALRQPGGSAPLLRHRGLGLHGGRQGKSHSH